MPPTDNAAMAAAKRAALAAGPIPELPPLPPRRLDRAPAAAPVRRNVLDKSGPGLLQHLENALHKVWRGGVEQETREVGADRRAVADLVASRPAGWRQGDNMVGYSASRQVERHHYQLPKVESGDVERAVARSGAATSATASAAAALEQAHAAHQSALAAIATARGEVVVAAAAREKALDQAVEPKVLAELTAAQELAGRKLEKLSLATIDTQPAVATAHAAHLAAQQAQREVEQALDAARFYEAAGAEVDHLIERLRPLLSRLDRAAAKLAAERLECSLGAANLVPEDGTIAIRRRWL
jgi:chorismate mutase